MPNKPPEESRVTSIAALLDRAGRDLAKLRQSYSELSAEDRVPSDVYIDTHDLLGRYRAALDYAAQEIGSICFPLPKRVHFPIASLGKLRPAFEKEIDDKFKGLRAASPRLRDYLIAVQHYGGDNWLVTLNDLSNLGKHDDFARQLKGDFVASYIGAIGHDPAVQLLGTGALVIEDGGVLQIDRFGGRSLRVQGPQTITTDTPELLNADAGIYLKRTKWTDFKFEGVAEHSVVGLLEHFHRSTPMVVDRIVDLTGQYHRERRT